MTEISPEAQALIDRLARMDLARPRHDKTAIEQAIMEHLKELGIPERPFIWAEDVRTGHRIVTERAKSAVDADENAWLDAEVAWGAIDDDWEEDEEGAWEDARALRDAAMKVAIDAVWAAARITARDAAQDAVWAAARSATDTTSNAIDAASDAAANVLRPTRDPLRGDAVWIAAKGAATVARAVARSAAVDAAEAITYVNFRVAFEHPTTAKLVSTWLPMLDAFEAGLFLYWLTPHDIICVLQPSLSIGNGPLHRADRPPVT